MGQHGGDDLRLVAVAFGKQRPDRAVDQARDERLLLGRPALALEIAAGDAAGGEGLFLVIDGERKEIDAGLWLPWRRRRSREPWSRHRSRATAPSAWRAILPVSSTSLRPAQSSSSRWISNIHSSSLGKGEVQGQSKTARSCENHYDSTWRSCHEHWSSPWFARRPDAAALPDI